MDEKSVIEHYLTDEQYDFIPLSASIETKKRVEQTKPADEQTPP
jgi:hypothetical protein